MGTLDDFSSTSTQSTRKVSLRRRAFRKRLMRLLPTAGIIAIIALCALSIGSVIAYAYFASSLPSADRLASFTVAQSTKIFDRNGELLFEVFDPHGGRRTVVPIQKIPRVLKDATIATEDKSFYTNPGVDLRGILRAIYYDVRRSEER